MTDRIEKTIDLAAPVARVWRAIADHHEFGDWFGIALDRPFAEGEPVRATMTYQGRDLGWTFTVTRIEPERRFAFTWHPYAVDPDTDYSGEEPTTVEFTLEARGERTRLTIVESGFDRIPEHRRAEAFRMNEGGWTQQVENVRAHVER